MKEEKNNLNNVVGIELGYFFLTSIFGGIVASYTSPGPAPNSGDGVPDGSGFESPIFPVELVIIFLILLIGLSVTFFLFKLRKKKKLASYLATREAS